MNEEELKNLDKEEKTTSLQLFKRRQRIAQEDFDPQKASRKEIREYHKRNYRLKKNKMRKLRCKVLMLTKEIRPEEPGHAIYRKNRMEKIDAKYQTNEEKRYSEAMDAIKSGKRSRFVMSKFHITERNAPRYRSTPLLCSTPATLLRKDHKIEEICSFLNQEEIQLICDDPLYYFSVNGKVIDENLLEQKKWDQMAGLTPEKRKKNRKFTTNNSSFNPVLESLLLKEKMKSSSASGSMIYSKYQSGVSTKITNRGVLSTIQFQEANNFFMEKRAEKYRRVSSYFTTKLKKKFDQHKKKMTELEKLQYDLLEKKIENMNDKMIKSQLIKKAIENSKLRKIRDNQKKQKEKEVRIQKKLRKISKIRELKNLGESIRKECVRFKTDYMREKKLKKIKELREK